MPAVPSCHGPFMIVRLVAIAAACPLLLLAAFGLSATLAPGLGLHGLLEAPARVLLHHLGLAAQLQSLKAVLPAGAAGAAGLVLLWLGLGPRGGGGGRAKSTRKDERGDGEGPDRAQAPSEAPSARAARQLEKRAAALAKKGQLVEAAELCRDSGLADAAVRYYVEAGRDRAGGRDPPRPEPLRRGGRALPAGRAVRRRRHALRLAERATRRPPTATARAAA